MVDYLVAGGARVTWEMDRHFIDPLPHVFTLQASQAGVETADDWVDVGGAQTNVFFLVDPSKRLYGKTPTLHYRVKLVTSLGTYTSPVAGVLGKMDFHGHLLFQEVVRKETLRHRLFASVQGWLLKARRYGTVCSCVDPNTGEVKDANHQVCLGTGWVTGYHPPVSCQYCDTSLEQSREHRNMQTGMSKPVVVTGRFLGFPPVTQGDVFVSSGSDDRFYLHGVKELASWRGVPIVLEAEMRRSPYSDVIYSYPVPG